MNLLPAPSFRFIRAASALACLTSITAVAQTFSPLTPGFWPSSISDDGQTIAGTKTSNSYSAPPVVWSQANGFTEMEAFPTDGNFLRHYLTELSGDGSTAVGIATWGAGTVNSRSAGFRWTAETGTVGIGHLSEDVSSEAAAVSANGRVVVGVSFPLRRATENYTPQAIRWTPETGVVGLGSLGTPGTHSDNSEATGVSADGSVVVGKSNGQVFRWTEETGMQGLGFGGSGIKISPDGTAIAGWGFDNEPFRWTEDLGLIPLGNPDLTAGSGGRILAMNFDGSLIIGSSFDNLNRLYPFIWSPTSGLRDLRTVLDDVFGLEDELAGWGNLIPSDLSTDGRYLIGRGTNPFGQSQSWLIDLGENYGPIPPGVDPELPPYIRPVPEPSTYGAIAAGALVALIFMRRRRAHSIAGDKVTALHPTAPLAEI